MQDSLLNAFPPADVHAVGVVAVDASGRQIYVNQAFADMLGWSAEELTGAAPPYVYWPTEEIEHIRAAFLQPIQGDTPTPLKVKFRRKCGERFDALLSISQLCAEGIGEGWVAAVADASFHTEILPIALFLREAEVKLQAAAAPVEFTIERAPTALSAVVDRAKLQQILVNLVSIAAEVALPTGNVRLWCESNAEVVALRVRANGSESSAGNLQGRLGLAIARDLARAMGGDVKVNTEPQRGSTFTVELPRTV